MLFNIYISDIPDTVSTRYGYADDLTLLFSHNCCNEVEEFLSSVMQNTVDYCVVVIRHTTRWIRNISEPSRAGTLQLLLRGGSSVQLSV